MSKVFRAALRLASVYFLSETCFQSPKAHADDTCDLTIIQNCFLDPLLNQSNYVESNVAKCLDSYLKSVHDRCNHVIYSFLIKEAFLDACSFSLCHNFYNIRGQLFCLASNYKQLSVSCIRAIGRFRSNETYIPCGIEVEQYCHEETTNSDSDVFNCLLSHQKDNSDFSSQCSSLVSFYILCDKKVSPESDMSICWNNVSATATPTSATGSSTSSFGMNDDTDSSVLYTILKVLAGVAGVTITIAILLDPKSGLMTTDQRADLWSKFLLLTGHDDDNRQRQSSGSRSSKSGVSWFGSGPKYVAVNTGSLEDSFGESDVEKEKEFEETFDQSIRFTTKNVNQAASASIASHPNQVSVCDEGVEDYSTLPEVADVELSMNSHALSSSGISSKLDDSMYTVDLNLTPVAKSQALPNTFEDL